MFNKKAWFILSSLVLLFPSFCLADISHYKEILVGDRGANMAGAYSAVADDASGAYYNPAGLVFGAKDAMTGISNSTNFVYNKYDEMVGDESEEIEGWRYLITFIGYMKRFGRSVIGLSYAIDDSTEVHQDQIFENDLVLNRRGDDRTYKYGPSWAYQFSENFSWGVTLYVYQREYYMQTNRLLDTKDDNSRWSFDYTKGSELGYHTKTGFLLAPSENISLALTLEKTGFTHTEHYLLRQTKDAGSATINYSQNKEINSPRKTPLSITFGFAWFATAYTLFTSDFDYHYLDEENKVNVLNVSMGLEHYINEQHVLRGGLYTNFDNDIAPSAATTGIEKIDTFGFSAGYSIFNGPTMITIGAILSYGIGQAQQNPANPSEIQNSTRETYAYSLAVSFNID